VGGFGKTISNCSVYLFYWVDVAVFINSFFFFFFFEQ
jgi:hypothetical protein